MAAILMRAKQLDAISPHEEKELWRELARRGWKRREPAQLDVKGEDPVAMYRQLVQLHVSELGYTENQLASKLNLSSKDIRTSYLNGDKKLRVVS